MILKGHDRGKNYAGSVAWRPVRAANAGSGAAAAHREALIGLADLHLRMLELGGVDVITMRGMSGMLGAFALDAVKDFLALHRHALRGIDAESHLIALDAQHCHRDFVPDHHRFTDSTRQDWHCGKPP